MIRSRRLNRRLALLLSALMLSPSSALANPLGAQVVGGQATVQGQGTNSVTITQGTNNAIINWNTFNIGLGEKTQFIQPSASSIALNRVVGGLGPSHLRGLLTANGQIFLVNPNGVLIGRHAVINAAGFLATTHDISNADFMAGHYNFNIPGRPDASIVNFGNISITPSSSGFAALVAPGVRNAGVITADLGRVALASGNGFTLDFYGDKLITLQVNDQIAGQVIDVATRRPLKSLVSNEGTLQANGGQIALTAVAARAVVDSVINNSGVIEANSVGTKNGMIVLGAATAATKGAGAPTQTVKISGTLSAKGSNKGETGGTVQVTGEAIELKGAKIDASGDAGGGKVLIGGKNLHPSTRVTIDNSSIINVSATGQGNGGNVVVWSNGLTSVTGTILATGGPLGGNGGSVETSGQTVYFNGIHVDTSAPSGQTGMWLIDPTNLTINSTAAATISADLGTTNITLQTDGDGATSGPRNASSRQGDIDVNAPITWNTNSSLTLSAFHDININANVTSSGGGAVIARADNTGTGTGTVSFGTYSHHECEECFHSQAMVSTSGPVSIFYNPTSYASNDSSSVKGGSPFSHNVTGGGKLTAYMLVNTATDLQHVGTNLDGVYALGRNIDATGVTNFKPIGSVPGPSFDKQFTGIFDGQYVNGTGPTISNLNINPVNGHIGSIGLFAINGGTIQNLNLSNITVTANAGLPGQYVGTLAGQNFGTVSKVTVANAHIVGGETPGLIAGGLVGWNDGTIRKSHVSGGSVSVGSNGVAGGLAGSNSGSIWRSSATADVTTTAAGGGLPNIGSDVFNDRTAVLGGLVGINSGRIGRSHAGGTVGGAGLNGVMAGGLVGLNGGTIWRSHATGNVTTGDFSFAGGLVALNAPSTGNQDCGNCQPGGTISRSWATGDVRVGSSSLAGGLAGINLGTIRRSRAGGEGSTVTAGDNSYAGGLVGANLGDIARSSARGDVTVGSNASGGGLVGMNGFPFAIGGEFAKTNENNSPTVGRIWRSHATGNVTSLGTGVTLGGLVGINYGGIARSHASGNVSAMAASNASSDCSASNSCMTNTVGGLVGWNDGTIRKSSAGGQGNEESTMVSVGSQGIAGGLVGFNDFNGRIWKSHAAVKVTGDPGAPSKQDVFNKVTILGGLVGQNRGFIGRSSASGAVGGTGDFLEVGGLVAKNNGTIWRSSATGDVTAGNFSSAGGLVAENNPGGQNCEGECGPAGPAKISHSYATGNVTVGSNSVAGGLAAINQGTINHTRAGTAQSKVAGGNNSILGGLVAVNDLNGMITNSSVFGSVASTGPNSVIGGFVGVNGGNIDSSQTAAAVTGTSNSYVGGFIGLNIGTIVDSQVVDPASVTVTGSGNVVGGFVGMNIGAIDPSTTTVTPQTTPGTNNIVGGFAGANFNFANVDFTGLTLPAPTFPTGTISTDSATTDNVHPFIGTDAVTSGPSTPPSPPSILNQCNDPLCAIIIALPLTTPQPTPPGPTPPGPTPPLCNDPSCQPPKTPAPASPLNTPPVVQIAPPNLFTNNNQLTLINLTTGGTGGTGGAGNGNGGNGGANGNRSPGPPPGPGLGRTLSEQQFSGVPPIGETRFLPGQIVMQISDTVSLADVQKLAAQFGITLISSQNIPGRVLYSFSFATSKDIRRLILALEHNNLVASVQPNYVFGLTQGASAPAAPATPRDQSPPPAGDTTGSIPPPTEVAPDLANSNTAALESLPVGDAAQYVIGKLHLGDVHRLARGRNVSVAVIDSEIDARHPDLAGVLAERYDATQSASRPHAHGTGMAGAIASHSRLLGVAPGVRLLAIKAFDESASTAEATSFQILKGLDYAIAKNVRIINMSFAGPRDPMMERTLKTAHDKGVILIAAAGNAGPKSPPLYPGADPSVIAVTATDYTDKPFSMANRGKYVAIAAPGVDVMVPAPGNTYQLTTGTSVAAAHVSGVAALLVERKPTITPDEVRAVLMRTARAFAALPKGELDGAGLIDPVGALQAVALGRSSEASPPARSATAH